MVVLGIEGDKLLEGSKSQCRAGVEGLLGDEGISTLDGDTISDPLTCIPMYLGLAPLVSPLFTLKFLALLLVN